MREKARIKQSRAGGDKSSNKRDEALLSPVSKPKIDSVHVQKAIASEAGVGDEKLYHYTQIRRHGSPKLLESVQSGKLKIKTAYRILETNKRLRRVDRMYKFIEESVPLKHDEETNQVVRAKLAEFSAMIDQLLDKLEGGEANDSA